MCSNSGRPCRVYVYIPPSKLHRHQSNNLPRKDVKSDDATTKAKRPPRTRVIRRFPSEVCRLITEIVDPSDLPSLSVVSTSFRTEAQRLIFQRLTMKKSSKAVAAECIRGLLDSPRLWTLIRHLDIWHVHLTRASRDVPIIERLATLFSKLVNLTSLTVRDHVHWDKCDGLFDKCAFRLKSLHIHFLPDHDLIAFLASQRSIVDLSWYPTTAGTTDSSFPFNPIQWPANLLPNLTVYAYYGRFPALLTSHLMHGRPITHFKSDLTPPPLQDLMRSSRLVKGLYIPPLDVNETISAGADFPYLEAFGILRYSTEKACFPHSPLKLFQSHFFPTGNSVYSTIPSSHETSPSIIGIPTSQITDSQNPTRTEISRCVPFTSDD
jgi:hypothetical protein